MSNDSLRSDSGVCWLIVVVILVFGSGCSNDSGSTGADAMAMDAGTADSATNIDGGDATAPMDSGTDPDGGNGPDGGPDGGNDLCGMTLEGGDSSVFDQTSSRFKITTFPQGIALEGAVYDGPLVEFHRESERQGPCRLLTYTSTLCTPACEGTTVCVDSQCVAYPTILPIGPVRLSGVGDDITIEASGIGSYYWFTENISGDTLSTVSVSAPGDVGPGFSLMGCAVTAPDPTSDWSGLLDQRAPGESVTLSWSNPTEGARVYLRMITGVGTHGGVSHTEIECEGRDTGSLTLPGSYLDDLYAQGWSCGECGGNKLFRYHATEVDADDVTIQLRLEAFTDFWHLPSPM